ncbi:LAQU0S16e02366g1_1 [Lachancea quebecensis]|uniref:LAQU0S16e02366g1_1 n=1 Tax=Lachancea quebecensis TaxID=1654605 RepID=A0A0P1KWW6_9SACH|nr:LAQU0S16e02366g1_1 [Lachancea quebecensis]
MKPPCRSNPVSLLNTKLLCVPKGYVTKQSRSSKNQDVVVRTKDACHHAAVSSSSKPPYKHYPMATPQVEASRTSQLVFLNKNSKLAALQEKQNVYLSGGIELLLNLPFQILPTTKTTFSCALRFLHQFRVINDRSNALPVLHHLESRSNYKVALSNRIRT